MLRHVLRAAGALALFTPGAAPAQQRAAFVVLPFENSGSYGQDKEVFEALGVGLPVMVARALSRQPGVTVAQGPRVTQALTRLGVGPGQRIDAATASQVAKAAGSRYTVTGSFSDFYGKFRVNARVVDAESGEILKVVTNDDPALQDRAQLGAIIGHVSDKIAKAAGVGTGGDAAAELPGGAILDYSRGLLHESRGDQARAADFFKRAADAAPGFEEAEAGLRRVRGAP
jgi:TolB-like protein